jgi:hypothetical protein
MEIKADGVWVILVRGGRSLCLGVQPEEQVRFNAQESKSPPSRDDRVE